MIVSRGLNFLWRSTAGALHLRECAESFFEEEEEREDALLDFLELAGELELLVENRRNGLGNFVLDDPHML